VKRERFLPLVLALSGCFPGLDDSSVENGRGTTPGSTSDPEAPVGCSGGRCPPQAIGSTTLRDPRAIVSTGTMLFYSALDDEMGVADRKGPVHAIGIDGTNGRIIEQAFEVNTMFANETHVAWQALDAEREEGLTTGAGDLRGCTLPACVPETWVRDVPTGAGVVVVGDKLFFGGDGMRTCTIGDCAAPRKIAPLASPIAVATDGKGVYWLNSDGNYGGVGIFRCTPPACSDAKRIVPRTGKYVGTWTLFRSASIVAAGGHVAWIEQDATVWIATETGDSPRKLAQEDPQFTQPVALASDGTNVYWTEYNETPSAGRVLACAMYGCPKPTVIAENQYRPTGLTVDATHVYWLTTEPGKGALFKIAK
jgi:hypothetical protein